MAQPETKKLGGDANGRKNDRDAGGYLAALVEGKKYTTLRDILVTMNAVDVAAVFEDMPQDKLPCFSGLLPKELAAETFVEMAPRPRNCSSRAFPTMN